nr:MAG TPA: hypothetical protein [Bacteriophage sp.]
MARVNMIIKWRCFSLAEIFHDMNVITYFGLA